jgi:site-specific recombinase XerD
MNKPNRLINRSNYLIVQEYLEYLLSVRNRNKKSVERYRFWLRRVLLWAMEHSLETADQIKPPFVQYINELELATESKKKIIETTRSFFKWAKLYHHRPYARLPAYWIEDLTPPRLPCGTNLEYVTLENALAIARLKIDRSNLALWRDQAMSAMLFLSGARAGAATSLPIKAVHLQVEYPNIEQKPSLGVSTKNKQSATTFLHHIPELLEGICEWDEYVRKNCPPEYPWYAPIQQNWGDQRLSDLKPGENRITALNRRLKILDSAAGLPHKSPHKYRHGYAIYGLQHCQTMAQYHALSRNLMHANIAITDERYVHLEEMERGKLLGQISSHPCQSTEDDLQGLLTKLDRNDLHRAITIAAGLLVKR